MSVRLRPVVLKTERNQMKILFFHVMTQKTLNRKIKAAERLAQVRSDRQVAELMADNTRFAEIINRKRGNL